MGLCLCTHLARGNYDDKEVTCRQKSPPGRLSIRQNIIQLLQPDAHHSRPPAYCLHQCPTALWIFSQMPATLPPCLARNTLSYPLKFPLQTSSSTPVSGNDPVNHENSGPIPSQPPAFIVQLPCDHPFRCPMDLTPQMGAAGAPASSKTETPSPPSPSPSGSPVGVAPCAPPPRPLGPVSLPGSPPATVTFPQLLQMSLS